MKLLDVENLNLGFYCENGFKQALFDVTFSLNKGEMLALVGESGCGKTISAMSILQLLPKNAGITSGVITFENQDLLKLSCKELQHIRGSKIALIPQDPMTSLNPLFTVGDQLLEVLKIHQNLKGKEAHKKAVEAFEAVQIPSAEERLKAYPHEFSGGMKQRAIIAMALACNAEILIADEPTTALDVTIQAQIMSLLQKIKKERGTAILLITHDLALVKENADNVAVMYAGRIVEKAPAKEFFENPTHPYSLALLNSLPSNREKSLETITGQPPSIQQIIEGCKFHPRCKQCMEICTEKVPPEYQVGENHISACFLQE
ncbi:ABC transporter ATP-binding protein [Spirochaetes bacterium]|uniref:ABC transporter ATP-binding protein n=1 Tax=Candidatus Scatousia excrementipullorum TaxID=2840936 RepID=A0A9D9GZ85_9BACT|nr:ABC transporter ATP-binding protein [Candidatus Scatousia excrementipullorum]